MSGNIDTELDNHVRNLFRKNSPIFSKFSDRVSEYIAALCKDGKLDRKFKNPVVQTAILCDLINTEYLDKLLQIREDIKTIFAEEEIEFRLYDISYAFHEYNRFCFIWYIGTKEIVLDVAFGSDETNPVETMYRTALISGSGDHVEGDGLMGTFQILELDTLPRWFVNVLKRNS